ncbi:MAG: hypothetical protein K1W16_14750 [Lachnospiraceae bacterium]
MLIMKNTLIYSTLKQLKLPLDLKRIINISALMYTFCEVVDHIDLSKYFADDKDCTTGRPRCDAWKLLKAILFAFMEQGINSLRETEKLYHNDI